MKVSIVEIEAEQEEEVLIKCHQIDENVLDLVRKIETVKRRVTGSIGDKIYNVPLEAVFYYETVDNKAFFYTKDKVFETKLKLFQFYEEYGGNLFFRASKSVILNVTKIAYISPSFSGRFEATLNNEEKVMISRQYVAEMKRLLGM